MPTYGYRCTACKHEFERFQKISDPAVTECETCGAPVKKIMYPVGIAFKGSGFYVNDYSAKGGSPSSVGKTDGDNAAPATPAPSTDTPVVTPPPAVTTTTTTDSKPAAASAPVATPNNGS